jgi:hypothetical protein
MTWCRSELNSAATAMDPATNSGVLLADDASGQPYRPEPMDQGQGSGQYCIGNHSADETVDLEQAKAKDSKGHRGPDEQGESDV